MPDLPPSVAAAEEWAEWTLDDKRTFWLTVAKPRRLVTFGLCDNDSPVRIQYLTPEPPRSGHIEVIPQQDPYVPTMYWLGVKTKGVKLYLRPQGVQQIRPAVVVVADDTKASSLLRTDCGSTEQVWVNSLRIQRLTELDAESVKSRIQQSRCRSVRSVVTANRLQQQHGSNGAKSYALSLLNYDDADLFERLRREPEFELIATGSKKRWRALLGDALLWL